MMNGLSWSYCEPNLGLGITLVLRLLIFGVNARYTYVMLQTPFTLRISVAVDVLHSGLARTLLSSGLSHRGQVDKGLHLPRIPGSQGE